MRSRIQLHADTPYVFADSVRGERDRMFFDHASPFYKAAVRFELGPLERDEFCPFLRESFAAGERSSPLVGESLRLATHAREPLHPAP